MVLRILLFTFIFFAQAQSTSGLSQKSLFSLPIVDQISIDRFRRSLGSHQQQQDGFLNFTFVNEPVDILASKDKKVWFDCLSNFGDAAKIRWRKDGAYIQVDRSGGRFSVLSNGSLVISSASGPREEGTSGDSDEGFYQCSAIVDDKWTFVSRKGRLVLSTLPRFEEQPENRTVNVGGVVHFSCQTSGTPPLIYIWFKDNVPVDTTNSRLTIIPSTGTLEIRDVRSNDQGSYKCRVTKGDKYRVSREGTLKIIKTDALPEASEPKFVSKPQGRVAKLDETVVLECAVDGFPLPSIQWLKDRKIVNIDERTKIVGQGSLVIEHASATDAGVYTCRAKNSEDTSDAAATVVVQIPPSIVARPLNVKTKETMDVEFECKADGHPSPSLIWLKNGETITSSEYFVIEGSKLKIFGLVQADQGVIQCLFENEAGSTQVSAQLSVESATSSAADVAPKSSNQVPSAALALKVVKSNSRSATLSWEPPTSSGGASLLGYSVFYKQEGFDRERAINVTVAASKEYAFQKLAPNSKYVFRVSAFNKNGYGPSSALLDVKTEVESSVPSIVRNLRAKATSPSSVEIRWDPPIDADVEILYYKLYYVVGQQAEASSVGGLGDGSFDDDYLDSDDEEETEIQVKDTRYVLHGLTAYTNYECRVEAVNANGVGIPSDPPLLFRTPSDVPSGPPRNVTAIPMTTDSVVVRWAPPAEKQRNGQIIGYKIRYKLQDRGSRVHSAQVDGPENHNIVEGLEAGGAYTFRVAALTINGTGPYSPWVTTASTSNDENEEVHLLGPPTSLKVEARGTEIHVSWTPPLDDGNAVGGFLVGWGINMPDLVQERIANTERSYVIRNLKPKRTYVISLRAFNKVGNGFPIYETVETTMGSDRASLPGAAPSVKELKPPLEVLATTKSSTSIVLTWTDQEPRRSNDGRWYNVSYSSPAQSGHFGRVRTIRTQKTTHTFDSLRPNTRYEFAVKVVLDGVESLWSMSTSNQTDSSAPTSPPTDLTVGQAPDNPSNVIIGWMPPKHSNGVILKYLVYYTTDVNSPEAQWMMVGIRGDRMTTTIDNLVPDTEYWFKIQAMNAKGYSPISTPPKLFRTTYRSSNDKTRGRAPPEIEDDDVGLADFADKVGKVKGRVQTVADEAAAKTNDADKSTFTIIIVVAAVAALLIVLLIVFGVVHCRRKSKLRGYTAGVKKSTAADAKPPPDLWIHHDHALELRNAALDKNPPSAGPSLQDLKQLSRRSPSPPMNDVPRYHSLAAMTPGTGTLGRASGHNYNHNHHHVSSGSVDTPPPYSARGYGAQQKTPQYVYTGPKGSQPHDGSSSPFGSGNVSALTPTPPPQVPTLLPVSSDFNNSKTLPANGGAVNRNSNPLKSFTVLTTPPPPPPVGLSVQGPRVHSARSAVAVDSPRHKTGSGVVIGTKAKVLNQQKNAAALNNGGLYSSDSNAYSSGKDTDNELPRSCSTEELTVQMRNLDNLMKDLNAISANEFDA